MIRKYYFTVVIFIVAIIIGIYPYKGYGANDKTIIEKSIYDDINKISDLKPFLLVESKYDKAVKQADKLREDFFSGEYAEIETFLDSINTKTASWDLSSLLRFYLKRLKEDPELVNLDIDLANANKWVKHSPDNEFAYTFRAHVYHLKGWAVRGTGFSGKVSSENFSGMEYYLRFAIADYYQALAINQKNDYAWGSLAGLSKASSDLGLNYYNLLVASEEYLPGSYYIKSRYLDRSKPRWGGSLAEMFYFSRSQNVKKSPELAMLLAYTHEHKADQYARNKLIFLDENVNPSLHGLDFIKLILEVISNVSYFQDVVDYKNNLVSSEKKDNYGGYWERYGEYFSDEKIWTEYSEAYKTVFSVQADFTEGLFEYANSARQSKRLEVADEYFDRAIISGVNFIEAKQMYYIARFHHVENKNIDKAIKFYTLYLERDPEYTDVKKAAFSAGTLNWYYGKKAAYAKSFHFSEIAYNLKPEDKRVLANHCNAFFNIFKYTEGISYCMRSLDIDSSYSWPHYMLHQIYQRLGDSVKSTYHHKQYENLSK